MTAAGVVGERVDAIAQEAEDVRESVRVGVEVVGSVGLAFRGDPVIVDFGGKDGAAGEGGGGGDEA